MKAKRVITFIICVIITFLPLLSFICAGAKEFIVLFALLSGLTVLLAAFIISRNNLNIKIGVIDILIIIYLVYGLCNSIFIKSHDIELIWIIKWILLITLYVIAKLCIAKDKISFYFLLSASAFIQAVICILQYLGIIEITLNPNFPHSGTFPTPGALAAFLAVGQISSFFVLIQVLKNRNIAYIILFIIANLFIFTAVILTDSRSALAALALCAAIFFNHYIFKNFKRKFGYVSAFITICSLIFFIAYLYNKRPDSVKTRLLLWKVSNTMIDKYPAMGRGVGEFSYDYMYAQEEYFQQDRECEERLFANNHYQSYNVFIQILVEQGYVGLILFLTVLVYVLLKGKDNCSRYSLLGLLICSCFLYTTDIYSLLLLFPVLIGLGVSDAGRTVVSFT